jgi:type I restriction enzyme, S subunit
MNDSILPFGWVTTTLFEISFKIVDGSHNPPPKQPSGLPMLSAQNILNNKIVFDNYRLIDVKEFELEYKRANVETNDVLLTIVGTIGRSTIVPSKIPRFTLQRSVALIKPALVNPKWLTFYLQSSISQKFFNKTQKGTAQKGVYLNSLNIIPVNLPPVPEQLRITQKIEELFSSLDNAIECIIKAQKQFKVYRQAVLKQAFEGEFTTKWRSENQYSLESFLDKLKKQKTEAIKSKLIKKDKYFEEPLPKNIIYKVPSNWLQLSWKTITSNNKYAMKRGPFGSSLKKEFFVNKGYTVYEQSHAINDDPYNTRYFISEKKYKEMIAFAVKPGEMIISCSGTLGRICLLPQDSKKGIINQALLKIDLDENIILKKFFIMMFRSETFQRKIFQKSLGTAMPNMVGMDELRELVIPIPSIAEQEQIIQEAESRLLVCDKIEESITQSLLQAEALRQSILKKAFEGKLVPQDPNDEPASKLLERIKKSRVSIKNIKKKKH